MRTRAIGPSPNARPPPCSCALSWIACAKVHPEIEPLIEN